jgi:hypothetical protein
VVHARAEGAVFVLPPRRLKVNFETDMDWTFRTRELGLG